MKRGRETWGKVGGVPEKFSGARETDVLSKGRRERGSEVGPETPLLWRRFSGTVRLISCIRTK